MHWAARYIGKPYCVGARGPDTYDCWGLVREVYDTRFGIPLPAFPGVSCHSPMSMIKKINEVMQHEDWSEVSVPFDGCAVAMSQSTSYHHVGLFVEADGSKILHCFDGHSVMIDSVKRMRLRGFKRIAYFKHRLCLT